MASHYQAVPSLCQQTKYQIASDVKQSMHRLSIKQNDSPTPLTSAKLFTCRRITTTNANGNLVFPLKEKHEASPKPVSKIVWPDLLNYLKSQRIVKNMDIFRKIPKTPPNINADQSIFPLENSPKSKTVFPCRLSNENNFNFIHTNKKDYKKSIKIKNRKTVKFPLKLTTGKDRFPYKTQALKEKWKNPKTGKLVVNKLDAHFPVDNSTHFPKELSLANQSSNHKLMDELKPLYKPQFSIYENPKKMKIENEYALICESNCDEKKFPCVIALKHDVLKKFPLKNEQTSETTSLSLESTLSLSMTQKGQHVSQVQDLQILPTTTTTFEHQQTPPQITNAKTTCDDSDVYKLSAIEAINNTRSNEVGLFEEKIERLQYAIVALFEKIQNSFRNTHISEHEKTNAINRNDHDDANDGNSNGNVVSRFALTPPTNSTTSVRNTERILRSYINNNDVYNKNICDLGDLWHDVSDQRGKIVERSSDVRDTLAETVDNGDKNENRTTSTGSFLVKSEEPIPPYTPEFQSFNESISTSLERSDILPKYNVLPPVNRNVNSTVINNSEVYINEIPTETEINENKLSINEESEVMTITRLEDNETDNLQSREEFIDLEIDEMKYEMNRTKGAVTSTLTEPRAVGKRDSLMTGNTNTNYGRNVSSNFSTRPVRDNNSSTSSQSATQRLTLQSENLRSPVSNYLPSDATTNRSNLTAPLTTTLNNALSSRSSTTLPKAINISNDALANRRPSLSSLRNTQSTSLLSQDLMHYSPAATTHQKYQITPLSRGASIDSSLDDVLPERTRLRRQRRLKPLDSLDEPEDPIERLNRLKARISASLSEVKGVLKQYSTEGEGENENATTTVPVTHKENHKEEKKEDEGPVTFRFVKKIRRRSLFSEEEEEKEKEKERQIAQEAGNDEVDHQPKANISNLEIGEVQTEKESKEHICKSNDIVESTQNNLEEIDKKLYPLKEEIQEFVEETPRQVEEKKEIDIRTTEIQEVKDKPKAIIEDISPDTKPKARKRSIIKAKDVSSKDSVLAAEDSRVSVSETSKATQPLIGGELKEIQKLDVEPSVPKELDKTSPQLAGDETSKGAIPKQSEKNSTLGSQTKTKKHDIIKDKEVAHSGPLQAKDIAPATIQEAQETSEGVTTLTEVKVESKNQETYEILKAEPKSETMKGTLPKQPESEAPKMRKKIIIKSKDPSRRASLAAAEGSKIEPAVKVAIPAKIVRRPSDSEAVVKKKLITAKINTSGSVEEVTPKPKIVKVKRSSAKSNAQLATTQTKIIEEESAMTAAAANDKSNDRVKSIDKQKSMHNDKGKDVLMPNESKINEITSQTNLLLPTQLVIDEAASLQAKTIENSQLQSNQKQEQAQVQKQNQQQATIKSTTTKFKSNELQQTGGDGGAMLENLTTTAISSIKTAEANGQQINRENGNAQQEDLNDLLLQQETTIIKPSTTKQEQQQVNEKSLENRAITVATEQKHTQQQVVKIDEISNNETERSPKEPCVDKLPTSTHIVTHEQQQQHHQPELVEGEQSITHETDTKAISSPQISISSTADSNQSTTTISKDELPKDSEETVNQVSDIKMPELQVTPAPVQTAELSPQPEQHKKKVILKKIVRQASIDKTKKPEPKPESQPLPEPDVSKANKEEDQKTTEKIREDLTDEVADRVPESPVNEELTEDISESTEISESSTSLGSEETSEKPKKERKVKQRVIIKRQKRRLSIGDNFFHPATAQEPQNAEVETLEKAISYVTDDDDDNEESTEDDEDEKKKAQEEEEQQKKPLKSCIMQKVYNIGDEVLYAERFKKTQIKWRRGRIKERITSISYLLDIDGKDVSSHINYLKKFTGRKVSFGGKEYLEIDYEQLAEEEEKAEKLQRRSYSIWNMV